MARQLVANLAEQGIGGIKPEARDETRGLPLSDSRYPAGSTIAGDETKIRYRPLAFVACTVQQQVCSVHQGCTLRCAAVHSNAPAQVQTHAIYLK